MIFETFFGIRRNSHFIVLHSPKLHDKSEQYARSAAGEIIDTPELQCRAMLQERLQTLISDKNVWERVMLKPWRIIKATGSWEWEDLKGLMFDACSDSLERRLLNVLCDFYWLCQHNISQLNNKKEFSSPSLWFHCSKKDADCTFTFRRYENRILEILRKNFSFLFVTPFTLLLPPWWWMQGTGYTTWVIRSPLAETLVNTHF